MLVVAVATPSAGAPRNAPLTAHLELQQQKS